jgi:NADH dehydrogenase
VHVSSIAVRFAGAPRYHYAESKKQAEEIVRTSGMPYTIVRPTLVLGPGSPNLESLTRLALMPVVPLFGGAEARVQPVHVDDLAAALVLICANPPRGETVEVGGPETLTMRDLLSRLRGAPLHSVNVPFKPLAFALGACEDLLFPLLPFTAGQLASFVCDGIARPGWNSPQKSVDEMLAHA